MELGYTFQYVESLRHEHISLHEKTFSILYKWKEDVVSHAIEKKLERALNKIERKDILDMLSQFSFEEFKRSAESYNIPNPTELITDSDLSDVVRKGVDFKRLARFLEIPNKDLAILELEYRRCQASHVPLALASLSKWKKHNKNLTRVDLCSGLIYIKMTALVDFLIEKWRQH